MASGVFTYPNSSIPLIPAQEKIAPKPTVPERFIQQQPWAKYILSFNWCIPSFVHQINKSFGNLSPLAKQIEQLAQDPSKFSDKNIKNLEEAFAAEEFPRLRPALAKILMGVSDENRDKILKHQFNSISPADGCLLVRRLQSVFEVQKTDVLAQTIKAQHPLFATIHEAASHKADEVRRRYEMQKQDQRHTLVRTAAMYALHTFDWFINMIMQVLHIKDTSVDDADGLESHFEAEMRFQGLMEELQLFSGWLLALYLLVGSLTLTVLITVSTAAVLATLGVIYFKWFKPPPEDIKAWTNVTKEAVLGRLHPVIGREAEVNKIIQQFVSNEASAKRHIIITGPTGVGKNEIVNLLAQKIAAGDVPDALKGDVMYGAHISDWLASGGDKPVRWNLDKLPRILGPYKRKVIIWGDEGKVAFMTEKNKSEIGEKLKQTMDFFSNCIITMTDEEYERYITDPAILRRTVRLQVKPLDEDYTHLTLLEMASREAPDLDVTKDAIDLASKVAERDVFKDCSQPFTSKDILARAFAKARTPKNGEVEKELLRLKKDRDLLETDRLRKHGKDLLPYTEEGQRYHKQLTTLYKKIQDLETIIENSNKALKEYLDLVKQRNELENATNLLAMRIQNAADNMVKEEILQQFILKLHYLLPSLDEKIKEKAQALKGVTTVITEELIEEIIKEKAAEIMDMKARQEKAKQLEEEENKDKFTAIKKLLNDESRIP